MSIKHNIVIVGGGSAGVNAVKTISKSLNYSKYNLILINPLPYRIWLVSALRVIVSQQDALEKESFLPYDRIFENGKGTFVEGVVAAIHPSKEGGGSVTLASGKPIE